ncbi:conserved hypothetical protein [Trichinella spiralis]|uniref:hypothetical protein n=1 Tax=Trichinella spiralis TaxID=6334 RepID=UPI0001EFE904|nr:conserved hypothetical protein [Trichinella spiralis]
MLRLASVALANQTPVGVSRDSIATQSDKTWRFVSRSPDALNVRYTSLPPLTVKIKCSPAVGSCTIYSCGSTFSFFLILIILFGMTIWQRLLLNQPIAFYCTFAASSEIIKSDRQWNNSIKFGKYFYCLSLNVRCVLKLSNIEVSITCVSLSTVILASVQLCLQCHDDDGVLLAGWISIACIGSEVSLIRFHHKYRNKHISIESSCWRIAMVEQEKLVLRLHIGHESVMLQPPHTTTPFAHTHRWTVFVRGHNGLRVDNGLIQKVIFQLHADFKCSRRDENTRFTFNGACCSRFGEILAKGCFHQKTNTSSRLVENFHFITPRGKCVEIESLSLNISNQCSPFPRARWLGF